MSATSNASSAIYALLCAIILSSFLSPNAACAKNPRTLHSFTGYPNDGDSPNGPLVRDGAGNLFGTTYKGGNDCNPWGCGTIFKIESDGAETVLHSFAGGSDGAYPFAGLIADKSGNLYGTTSGGGGTGCSGFGCGTVFKLSADGTETVLYAFKGGSDGEDPQLSLTLDEAGNLYGATLEGGGGTGCLGSFGCGIVFKLTADGQETILHAFTGGSDGAYPAGELVLDANGNAYGSASEGGSNQCNGGGCGILFRIALDGAETILYTFCDCEGGALPGGTLVLDGAGNLYGTAGGGGNGYGTVFKFTPDSIETALYTFQGPPNDGAFPDGLIGDAQGNFCGAT